MMECYIYSILKGILDSKRLIKNNWKVSTCLVIHTTVLLFSKKHFPLSLKSLESRIGKTAVCNRLHRFPSLVLKIDSEIFGIEQPYREVPIKRPILSSKKRKKGKKMTHAQKNKGFLVKKMHIYICDL